jgi:hypothetical protein
MDFYQKDCYVTQTVNTFTSTKKIFCININIEK